MDDAEQSTGRGSTVEGSTGTSSTEVAEPRPSHAVEAGAGAPLGADSGAVDEPAGRVEPGEPVESVEPVGSAEPVGSGTAGEPSAEEDSEPVSRRRRRRMPAWVELPLLVAISMAIVLVLNAFVAQPFVIPSGSMENTLQIGDRVLVNKLAYEFGDIRRGDVIVFDGRGSFVPDDTDEPGLAERALSGLGSMFGFANSDDSDFVKRVIGIGGDRVTCCDQQGRITVNGVPLDEGEYLYPGDQPSSHPFDVLVPEGRLWVMGDHRSNSSDSRAHLGDPGGGFVPEERVIGRAQWIIWPFGRIQGTDRPKTFDQPGLDGRG